MEYKHIILDHRSNVKARATNESKPQSGKNDFSLFLRRQKLENPDCASHDSAIRLKTQRSECNDANPLFSNSNAIKWESLYYIMCLIDKGLYVHCLRLFFVFMILFPFGI